MDGWMDVNRQRRCPSGKSRRHGLVDPTCTKSEGSETKERATKPRDKPRARPGMAIGDERTTKPISQRRSLRAMQELLRGSRARRTVPGPTSAPPGRPLCQ